MESSPNIVEHNEALKKEGLRIVTEGNKRGFHLRLLGAIAFQTHCPKYNYLTLKLRRMLSDVDFAGYANENAQVVTMMRELGYADQPMITALWGDRRTIWDHKSNGTHVDIFFEKLEMNDDIPFANRLHLEPFTITLADMLLEKMQIVHINEKDIIDTIMLLRNTKLAKEIYPKRSTLSTLAVSSPKTGAFTTPSRQTSPRCRRRSQLTKN